MTVPPAMPTSELVRAECQRVLASNWQQGVRSSDGTPFGYTSPNPIHYPWQWYWDSCFSAISWRHFDPERSRTELQTLLSAARPDGFIGHTVFWNAPLKLPRSLGYNITGRRPQMTSSIQPPLLAWAWKIAVGDPALEPGIWRHHDWLERNRDLEGDGLIWIVQPDESGLDASPQFDPIWRWRAHALPLFPTLVWRNRRADFDAREVRARGWSVVCEVTTNVLYSLSRSALGMPSLTQALIDRCYDERTGLFHADVHPAIKEPLPVTWSALSPLALPDLPEQIGRRLVEEHLLDPERFWFPAGPSSAAGDAPGFQRGDSGPLGIHRYWRGPVWVNAAWMLWLGLVRLGYADAASELAQRISATVATHGLFEYFDPVDGTGMGQPDFGWSTLVLELRSDNQAAATSYL